MEGMKKVTLANLAEVSAQDVFNQVAQHLLDQRQQCTDTVGMCRYRYGNMMCAAGCLMTDDEYSPAFECCSWHGLMVAGKVPKVHENLIQDLQELHDDCQPEDWPKRLELIAHRHGLTM